MSDELAGFAYLAFVVLLVGLVALTVGIGYLLGAGYGWLFFGLLCLLVVYGMLKLYKAKVKEELEKQ